VEADWWQIIPNLEFKQFFQIGILEIDEDRTYTLWLFNIAMENPL